MKANSWYLLARSKPQAKVEKHWVSGEEDDLWAEFRKGHPSYGSPPWEARRLWDLQRSPIGCALQKPLHLLMVVPEWLKFQKFPADAFASSSARDAYCQFWQIHFSCCWIGWEGPGPGHNKLRGLSKTHSGPVGTWLTKQGLLLVLNPSQ